MTFTKDSCLNVIHALLICSIAAASAPAGAQSDDARKASGSAEAKRQAVTQSDAERKARHEEYSKTWNSGNVEALAAGYTLDSITLQWGGQVLSLEEFKKRLPALTKIKTSGTPIYRIEVGDYALGHSRWVSQVGDSTRTTESYGVFRRQPDGRWLVVIDDPGIKEPVPTHLGDVSEYERLWNAGDVDAIAAMYSYDSVTLQPGGKRLNRQEFKALLPQLMKAKVQGQPIYRIEVGDIALEQSRWTSRIPGEKGVETVVTDSYVMSRRQPDGSWLIVVDDPGLE